jgi:hypothetical protein
MNSQWNDKIFSVTGQSFQELALEIFRFQYSNNPVYKAYIDMLEIKPADINSIVQIPFLPIQFFKTHEIKTTEFEPQAVFESSGTTGTINSRHLIKDIGVYKQSFLKGLEMFYGPVNEWCIIGLLPSYLERKNSSLVFMVDALIRQNRHSRSGFFLYEYDELYKTLKQLEEDKQKTLLIGVSFALLDFAEEYSFPLKHTVIMETGGMKGRKDEIVRQELHEILKTKFKVDVIHSEYGMTELLSQAYSRGNGIFHCPPWMKVLIRDEEDPFDIQSGVQSSETVNGLPAPGSRLPTQNSRLTTQHSEPVTKRGVINIIDLSNIYSCSFIATDDAGKLNADGSFEVLGRIDNSDIRGCSLMIM